MHELLLILFFLSVIQFVDSAITTIKKIVVPTTPELTPAEVAMEMALFDEDDEQKIKVFEDHMPEMGTDDGWGNKGCGNVKTTKAAGAGHLRASVWGVFLPIYMLGKRLIFCLNINFLR